MAASRPRKINYGLIQMENKENTYNLLRVIHQQQNPNQAFDIMDMESTAGMLAGFGEVHGIKIQLTSKNVTMTQRVLNIPKGVHAILFCPRNQTELNNFFIGESRSLYHRIQNTNSTAKFMIAIDTEAKLDIEGLPSTVSCIEINFADIDQEKLLNDLHDHFMYDVQVCKRSEMHEQMTIVPTLSKFPPGVLPICSAYLPSREETVVRPASSGFSIYSSSDNKSSSSSTSTNATPVNHDGKKCSVM